MKIQSVRIKNFRALKDVTIPFDSVTTFIGPNGAGKSTVLRALDWFFNGKPGPLTERDCSFGATDEDIEVQVSFYDLTEKDRDELGKYAPEGVARQAASKLAEATLTNELQKAAATKDAEIQGLKAKLDAIEVTQKLAITEAVSALEKDRDELKSGLQQAELQKQLAEKALKDKYETQITCYLIPDSTFKACVGSPLCIMSVSDTFFWGASASPSSLSTAHPAPMEIIVASVPTNILRDMLWSRPCSSR